MVRIIVPTSSRTTEETRAERRRREEEEQERRRRRMMPSKPVYQDKRRPFRYEELSPDIVRGKPLLTTEQLAGGPGLLTRPSIGMDVNRPGQRLGKLGKIERATAPIYAPGKMLLGGLHQSVMEPSEATITALGRRAPTDVLPEDFRYATLAGEPLGQTGMLFAGKEGLQKAWERFKTMRPAFTGGREGFSPFPFGPGLTQKQKEERPWQEELAGAALFAPAPILTVPKIPRAIGRGTQIAREAYLAKTMAPLPGRGSRIPPQLGKVTPSGPIIKPTDQPLPVRPTQQAGELYGRMEGRIAQPWMSPQVRFASTMSSGGTVEAGLRQGSAVSVHASELSPARVRAYNAAHGTNYTARNIADNASLRALKASQAEHYHASPVCKHFTAANRIKTADPNDLAIARSVARDIREANPPTVSIENVPAYQDTALFGLITKELDDGGYNWDVIIVDAADHGAAQARKRMIVRAVRKDVGELPPAPQKTHNFSETGQGEDWYLLLEDLIRAEGKGKPLLEEFTSRKPGEINDEIKRIQRYIGLGKLNTNSPLIAMGESASKNVPSASNAGGPAPTLLASERSVVRIIFPGAKGLEDATAIRVTPRMMNRLMGLPESYVLPSSRNLAKNILGDGVHGAITRDFIQPLVDIHRAAPSRAVPPTAPVRAAADVPTAPVRAVPPRERTVDELLEAGEYEIPKTQWELQTFPTTRYPNRPANTLNDIEGIIKNAQREQRHARRMERLVDDVFNDIREPNEELDDLIENLRSGPDDDIPWDEIRATYRTEMEVADSKIIRWQKELDEKSRLIDNAKADAIERGIGRIGRTEEIVPAPTAPARGQLTDVEDIAQEEALYDIASGASKERMMEPPDVQPKRRLTDAEDMAQEQRISPLESGVRGIAPEPVAPARVAPPDDVPPGRPPDEPPIGDGGDSDFGFGGVVNGDNPIDMRYIIPHLTGTQEVLNVLRKSPQILLDLAPIRFVAGKLSPKQEGELFTTIAQKPSPGFGVLDHPASQAAVTEYRRVGHAIQSMGNRVTFLADDIVKTFELDEIDKFGRVVGIRGDDGVLVSLRGIDDTLTDGYFDAPGKKLLDPTLRDIAARLPLFEDYLRPATVVAIRRLGRLIDEYRSLLDTVGNEKILIDKKRDLQVKARITGRKPKPVDGAYEPVENPLRIGSREDVRKDGGVYFARGNAYDELADTSYLLPGEPYTRAILTNDSPSKLRGVGLQKVERRHATFRSESAGIEAGYEYTPLGVAVQNQILKYGNESLNTHMQNYYRSMADDTGQYLGRTPKMRMLDENPAIIKTMEALRNKVTSLKSSLGRLTQEERIAIDSFLYGEGGDINEFIIALGRIEITKGKRQGANIPMLQQLLKEAKEEADTFKPKYNAALLKAEHVPKKQAITGGETAQFKLEKLSFPEQIAQSTVKALQDIGPTGFWAQPHAVVKFYNGFFKATNATMDNSSIGIQGLISLSKELSNPKVWNQWVRGKPTPAIQAIFANFKAWFDPDVMRSFLATYDQRALENGVLDSVAWAKHGLQGPATEYTEALARPGLGTRVGRLPVIKQADRAFQAHGYTQRLGGVNTDLMNLLASRGWKPGQPIKQFVSDDDIKTIAKEWNRSTGQSHRRFLGPIGDSVQFAARFTSARLEFLGKGLMGSIPRVGPMPPLSLDQRLARNSFIRFYSSAITTTFAANYFRGYPTDVRPTIVDKNGKRHNNPNFMRIRNVFGADISAFGPMNAMHNLFINAAIGSPAVFVNPGSGIMSLFEKLILQRDEFGREMPRPMDFPGGIGLEELWDSGTARWVRSMIGEFIPWSIEEMGEILKPIADTDEGIPSRIGESLGRFTTEQLGTIKSRFTERDRRELEGVPFKPTGLPSGAGGRMRPSQNRSSGTTERIRPSQNRVGVR